MTVKRRNFKSDEKVSIIRRHLLEQVPISDLCDEHGIHPTVFYQWQKTMFEKGAAAFESEDKLNSRRLERELASLRVKLANKDGIIAELLGEHIALKRRADNLPAS